ncbi:hypothetical protein GCM10025787_25610 [Saccharopolyspora rosea]
MLCTFLAARTPAGSDHVPAVGGTAPTNPEFAWQNWKNSRIAIRAGAGRRSERRLPTGKPVWTEAFVLRDDGNGAGRPCPCRPSRARPTKCGNGKHQTFAPPTGDAGAEVPKTKTGDHAANPFEPFPTT